MRPKISWSDLPGRKVGVWGAGVEGRASLRKLGELGVTPVLVDDRPAAATIDGLPVTATAEGGLDLLRSCEVVIKTPGISRYAPQVAELEKSGVAVAGGLAMWLEEAPLERVVGVTGTKGKSTTTSILGHLLTGLGHRPFAGGNLGLPPYDPKAPQDPDLWIVEVSSYQATDVATSPPIVAVTSLHPDHLPWHRGVDNYYADKLSLCSQPGAVLTIANGEDARLRERRSMLGPRVRWVTDGPAAWLDTLGLPGRHNRINALIAAACFEELGIEVEPDALIAAAAGFPLLPSRLEPVGSVEGVEFVDDSLSTNVLSAISALEVYPDRRVALIVGGHDRDIDYTELGGYVAGRQQPTMVVGLPETGRRVIAAIEPGSRVESTACMDLGVAVRAAFEWARPDGVVLLSPAAASFGDFRDYRHRSEVFAEAMRSLRKGG